jgi:hypothetical protein
MKESHIDDIVAGVFSQREHWEVPIDLVEIANQCGVSSISRRPLEVSGMVTKGANGYDITLNSNERLLSRQRFTLAHEIAHIVLSQETGNEITESHREVGENTRGRRDSLEKLCDTLAAQFLMPRALFLQYAPPWNVGSIPRLARQFETSILATAIRFAELMPTACVLTIWRPDRKSTDRLLPMWSSQNKLCGKARYHGPVFNRLSKDSVVYQAFRSSNPVEGTMMVPKITREGASYRKTKVEAVGYGNGDNRRVCSLFKP